MGIPICDDCAKKELGNDYNAINKTYMFVFFAHCVVCDDYFKENYCIPEKEKKGETGLEAIKRYLKGER